MARRPVYAPLDVYLNARLVGRLQRRASGAVEFTYDAGWLQWSNASPISLSLPLREDRYTGEVVLSFFDHLLPDEIRFRRRIAERVHAAGDDVYSLIAAIGRDCVGALQFLPVGENPGSPGVVYGTPLEDGEFAHLITNLSASPLGMDADREFRISLAGAQEKTALLWWRDRWHLPRRNTATTHIIKPQIGHLANGLDLSHSVENEHITMCLVAAFGLPCAPTRVVDIAGLRVLAVERFDRAWTTDGLLLRRPQEDTCQALAIPSAQKYEADGGPGIASILELLRASDDPATDRQRFLQAQIVFWLTGATDGHAKNFSVLLRPGGGFRLAPLYDVISAQPARDAGQMRRSEMRLAMAVGDNRHYVVDSILPHHFIQTGIAGGLNAKIVSGMLHDLKSRSDAAIEQAARELPSDLPAGMFESIAEGVHRRARLIVD
jgi:serine/threonine-protein kinase HipA